MTERPEEALKPLEAAPVSGPERIHVIDALRGFALFGVLAANIWLWFSGTFLLFPDYQSELQRLTFDSVSYFLINTLISGKFITIFSFLFGLGFAIQLQRAAERGQKVSGLYLRRLATLLLIGVVHGWLIWYGDILLIYSLLGFFLLLFAGRRPRTLLIWAVVLVVGWPFVGGLMTLTGGGEAAGGFEQQLEALAGPTRAAFAHGGYTDIVAGNVRMLEMFWTGGQYFMFLPYVLGLFLIGLLVGRAGVLARPGDFVPQLRRIRTVGLVLGLPANLVLLYLAINYSMVELFSRPALLALQIGLFPLSLPPLAAFYVSCILLAWQGSEVWRRRLEVLAPVGRMALTNYLSHSVICIGIYYGIGLGLMETLTPASTLPIAAAIFTLQILWSRWWLRRYRFGPAEWVWRSLTYRKLQPMPVS